MCLKQKRIGVEVGRLFIREMELEEARGSSLDRNVYRNKTDSVVSRYDIQCVPRQTFDVVRRDGGHVRWGSTGSSRAMWGCPVET